MIRLLELWINHWKKLRIKCIKNSTIIGWMKQKPIRLFPFLIDITENLKLNLFFRQTLEESIVLQNVTSPVQLKTGIFNHIFFLQRLIFRKLHGM